MGCIFIILLLVGILGLFNWLIGPWSALISGVILTTLIIVGLFKAGKSQ